MAVRSFVFILLFVFLFLFLFIFLLFLKIFLLFFLAESSLPEYVDLLFSVDKMIGRTSVFEAAFHSGSDVVAGWLLKYTEKIKIKML